MGVGITKPVPQMQRHHCFQEPFKYCFAWSRKQRACIKSSRLRFLHTSATYTWWKLLNSCQMACVQTVHGWVGMCSRVDNFFIIMAMQTSYLVHCALMIYVNLRGKPGATKAGAGWTHGHFYPIILHPMSPSILSSRIKSAQPSVVLAARPVHLLFAELIQSPRSFLLQCEVRGSPEPLRLKPATILVPLDVALGTQGKEGWC